MDKETGQNMIPITWRPINENTYTTPVVQIVIDKYNVTVYGNNSDSGSSDRHHCTRPAQTPAWRF
jgi:hypothetical protein